MLYDTAVSGRKRLFRSRRFNEFLFHAGFIAGGIVIISPLLLLIMVSLTDEMTLARDGFRFLPQKISLNAYVYISRHGAQIFRSYFITIVVTVVGTMWSLLAISLVAYPLSRRNFAYQKFFSLLVLFTLLFNGGLVPWYMVCTRVLGLNNSILALILPPAVSGFHVLIMRTFFRTSVPEAVIESAKMDGASELMVFFKVVVPMAVPAMATIGMFKMFEYWNDWWHALMFIEDPGKTPIQYMLMRVEQNIQFILQNSAAMAGSYGQDALSRMPLQTARMAIAVIVVVPVVIIFPYFQKYFAKGLTLGAIKG